MRPKGVSLVAMLQHKSLYDAVFDRVMYHISNFDQRLIGPNACPSKCEAVIFSEDLLKEERTLLMAYVEKAISE